MSATAVRWEHIQRVYELCGTTSRKRRAASTCTGGRSSASSQNGVRGSLCWSHGRTEKWFPLFLADAPYAPAHPAAHFGEAFASLNSPCLPFQQSPYEHMTCSVGRRTVFRQDRPNLHRYFGIYASQGRKSGKLPRALISDSVPITVTLDGAPSNDGLVASPRHWDRRFWRNWSNSAPSYRRCACRRAPDARIERQTVEGKSESRRHVRPCSHSRKASPVRRPMHEVIDISRRRFGRGLQSRPAIDVNPHQVGPKPIGRGSASASVRAGVNLQDRVCLRPKHHWYRAWYFAAVMGFAAEAFRRQVLAFVGIPAVMIGTGLARPAA